MITDITKVLSSSQPWPPESEKARIKLYSENEKLWAGAHAQVYGALGDLYHSNETESRKILVILSWPRRISTLWADLLFGEWPAIKAGKLESLEDIYLRALQTRLGLRSASYQVAVDMSRFGTGVFKLRAVEGKPAQLQAIHPKNWYPIVDQYGELSGHLIAWISPDGKRLNTEVHTPGQIVSGWYNLIEGALSGQLQETKKIETGIDVPLVFPAHNFKTSGDEIGQNDYQPIDAVLKRLELTLTRVGRVLDMHSEPAFVVPESALEKDVEKGAYYDSRKRIFTMEEGELPPQYITWDGQLVGAFSLVDRLMDQLYALSETCRAAFEPDKLGSQLSGTALRLLMSTPLKKVERLKLSLDPVLRALLQACSQLDVKNGVEGAVRLDDISITWYDGIPEDFREDVQNYVALKTAGLVSDESALSKLFGLEGDPLAEEKARLADQSL